MVSRSAKSHRHGLVATLFLMLMLAQTAHGNDGIINRIEALQAGYRVTVLEAPLMSREALTRFYLQRNFEPAWNSLEDRKALLRAIQEVADEGLNPADYHLEELRALALREPDNDTGDLQIDLDLVLSDAFLILGSHLLEGKVNPTTIHAEWTANRQQLEMHTVLAEALAGGDVYQAIQALKPTAPAYRKLVTARRHLARLLGSPWPAIESGPALKPGTSDARVPALRERLIQLGDLAGPDNDAADADATLLDNPEYDADLQAAVSAFQARHGLDSDGVVGAKTLSALNMMPLERIRQLDANMERWRWLPDDLGDTYVLVNIAGFEMVMVENGEEVLHQRVIVGRPYRQTPVFSDRIRYLAFNPTWTVPRSLMIKDQLPQIQADPTYLQRLNFRIYQGWGNDRVEVDPASVDWAALSPTNFPYQMVQQPGPQNALGQVKFMFPNQHDVYLHDTPARDLFQRTERSFSSGCIRVERPMELAERLLTGNSDWDTSRIEQALSKTDQVTALLKNPIPVHLQYWTSWVDSDGALQFRNDLYSRDSRLLDALRSDPRGELALTPRRAS
ncbi:MAG: L,D-transpeptidase family protein [Pseudomonadota bacterium]|nr:L,D-transpeptidase family protein [Pseudomonadota bacterium]